MLTAAPAAVQAAGTKRTALLADTRTEPTIRFEVKRKDQPVKWPSHQYLNRHFYITPQFLPYPYTNPSLSNLFATIVTSLLSQSTMLLSTRGSELCPHRGLLIWMLSWWDTSHLHLPWVQPALCLSFFFLTTAGSKCMTPKIVPFILKDKRQTPSSPFLPSIRVSQIWNHPFLGLVACAEPCSAGFQQTPQNRALLENKFYVPVYSCHSNMAWMSDADI